MGEGDGPDWFDDIMKQPTRAIGPKKGQAKPGPEKALRREVIKAIQDMKYLGSRPCVVPIYSGVAEHDGIRYSVGRGGSADLITTFFGFALHMELKTKNDFQSERQKKFQMRVEQAGGVYVLVRSPKDATDAMARIYNTHVAKLQPR